MYTGMISFNTVNIQTLGTDLFCEHLLSDYLHHLVKNLPRLPTYLQVCIWKYDNPRPLK